MYAMNKSTMHECMNKCMHKCMNKCMHEKRPAASGHNFWLGRIDPLTVLDIESDLSVGY